VPAAFAGAYLLHVIGGTTGDEKTIETYLGIALLIGALAMVVRFILDRRSKEGRTQYVANVEVRPLPTLALGIIGGLVVGLTSVGSGSLMIIGLLFIYPLLGANQLVGTDLTQAVPLTAAAAVGSLIFVSSSVPDRYVRPVITFVILASGLKYVGLGTTALGWALVVILLAAAATWLVLSRSGDVAAAVEPAAVEPSG